MLHFSHQLLKCLEGSPSAVYCPRDHFPGGLTSTAPGTAPTEGHHGPPSGTEGENVCSGLTSRPDPVSDRLVSFLAFLGLWSSSAPCGRRQSSRNPGRKGDWLLPTRPQPSQLSVSRPSFWWWELPTLQLSQVAAEVWRSPLRALPMGVHWLSGHWEDYLCQVCVCGILEISTANCCVEEFSQAVVQVLCRENPFLSVCHVAERSSYKHMGHRGIV